jgi:hypothetical protein
MSETDNTPQETPQTPVEPAPPPAPGTKVASPPERVLYDPNGDRYIRTDPNG